MNEGVEAGQSSDVPQLDLDAIKQRQRAAWASVDYGVIGITLQIVGKSLA